MESAQFHRACPGIRKRRTFMGYWKERFNMILTVMTCFFTGVLRGKWDNLFLPGRFFYGNEQRKIPGMYRNDCGQDMIRGCVNHAGKFAERFRINCVGKFTESFGERITQMSNCGRIGKKGGNWIRDGTPEKFCKGKCKKNILARCTSHFAGYFA